MARIIQCECGFVALVIVPAQAHLSTGIHEPPPGMNPAAPARRRIRRSGAASGRSAVTAEGAQIRSIWRPATSVAPWRRPGHAS